MSDYADLIRKLWAKVDEIDDGGPHYSKSAIYRDAANALESLRASLANEKEANQWKLISEAPRDGRRLILWLADEQFWVVGKWDTAEQMWNLVEWDMWTGEEGMHEITHFIDPATEELSRILQEGQRK